MRAPNLRAWVTARLVSSRAADPGREAEVVLDPPRGPGLAAEHGALDRPACRGPPRRRRPRRRGRPGRRRGPAGRPPRAAPARARSRAPARARRCSAAAARRRRAGAPAGSRPASSPSISAAASRRSRPGRARCRAGAAPREVDQPPGLAPSRRGPMISIPIPSPLLEQFAALDEGGEQQVGERAVLEQQLPQRLRGRRRCSASARSRPRSGRRSGRRAGSSRRGSRTAPWRTISLPAASRTATSPSRIAMNG